MLKSSHLGIVEVSYTIQSNNLNLDMSPASIMEDIGVNKSTVRIPDGADSVKVIIPIIDDNIPEIDEGFIVRLMSVTLVDGFNSSSPPRIGTLNESIVVISANDDAHGRLSFTTESLK